MSYTYNLLTFSGTFDRLHKGHQWMINEAFRLSKTVLIGITSDEFIKNKAYSETIFPHERRKKELIDYLSSHGWEKRSQIFTLNDPFGLGPSDKNLEAILVTRETLPNALKINIKRKENRLTPLSIEIRALIKGDDHKPIRSERIRFGEITRNGFSYKRFIQSLTSHYGIFTVPKKLYPTLRKPLGTVISGKSFEETTKKVISYIKDKIVKQTRNNNTHSKPVLKSFSKDLKNKSSLLISIGDVISDTLINQGIIPNVYIIDYKNERKWIKGKGRLKLQPSYINRSGTLSRRACLSVKNAIDKHISSGNPTIVTIRGEEDLLAIPAILFTPLESVVLYGQRNIGVVAVKVDENMKKKMINIISKTHDYSPHRKSL